MGNTRLKGAFPNCKWCHGNGCICCDDEREKAFERSQQPNRLVFVVGALAALDSTGFRTGDLRRDRCVGCAGRGRRRNGEKL